MNFHLFHEYAANADHACDSDTLRTETTFFVVSDRMIQSSQLRCISPIDNQGRGHYNRGRWLALERNEC